MAKIVAAIDFGTANSGVVWGLNSEGITNSFQYVNRTSINGYAKTRTSLLVRKSLMARIAHAGDDFKIYGVDDGSEVDVYFGNGVNTGRLGIIDAHDERNWVLFDYFKMKLHNNSSTDPLIKGSDNVDYKLIHVIGLYLRCLKRATLKAINVNGGSEAVRVGLDDIKWGVTIPTIWGANAKKIMGDAVRFGLGVDFISILEPEGAAASFATMMSPNKSSLTVGVGMRYMVVDCGGGTTDIVAQEVTKDGGYREIRAADGRAAAGWDVDNNFYELLAEKIAGRNLSGKDAYARLIDDLRYREGNFKIWLALEKEWLKLKEEGLKLADDEYMYPFELPRKYADWLRKSFPWGGDLFKEEDIVFFTQKEIRDRVCMPVIRQIIDAARSVSRPCGQLDYVFLAGGLSGLPFLQKAIEDFVSTECRNREGEKSKVVHEAQWADNHTLRGGTIMRGAAILLVYERMIQRVSKRNYYYTCNLAMPLEASRKDEVVQRLVCEYEKVGYSEHDMRDLAAQFMKDLRDVSFDDLGVSVSQEDGCKRVNSYVPVCTKGRTARKYRSSDLSVDGGGTGKLTFYSSDKDISFVNGTSAEDVREEGSVEVYLPKGESMQVEVDFNEFQQEFFEAKVWKNGTVEHTVKIKPEIKIGY